MFGKIISYIQNLLPNSETGVKRRSEKCNRSPPQKYMKMDYKNMISTIDLKTDYENFMESKKNSHYEEDDVCYVVDEINNESKTSQTMARKSIRKNHWNPEAPLQTLPTSFKTDVSRLPVIPNATYNRSTKAVGELKPKQTSDRIFKSYRVSLENSNCGDKNRGTSFQNMKQRLKALGQAHHLDDKHRYRQLLQSMSTRASSITAPKPSDQDIRQISVIDLTEEKSCVEINRNSENLPQFARTNSNCHLANKSSSSNAGVIQKVNSFRESVKTNSAMNFDVVNQILSRHTKASTEKKKIISMEKRNLEVFNETNRRLVNDIFVERVKDYMKITSAVILEGDLEYEEKSVLPTLTREQEFRINQALAPSPPSQTLAEKFGLQIKRRDMQTLQGMNWLNDEVINFYMNLIMERAKLGKLPSVYAFNTFFYQKLISGGHPSLKRWTKKVDIFSYDMILVPVHMGMHWCMSIIDFRSKEVRYYDSMGSPNNTCLQSLLRYLEDESQDKRKIYYSTADWKKNNVDNIPQQMNGSDCGVFACMFAEHVSRDSPILFTQDDMPYFRKKMVIEILEGKLLT